MSKHNPKYAMRSRYLPGIDHKADFPGCSLFENQPEQLDYTLTIHAEDLESACEQLDKMNCEYIIDDFVLNAGGYLLSNGVFFGGTEYRRIFVTKGIDHAK